MFKIIDHLLNTLFFMLILLLFLVNIILFTFKYGTTFLFIESLLQWSVFSLLTFIH